MSHNVAWIVKRFTKGFTFCGILGVLAGTRGRNALVSESQVIVSKHFLNFTFLTIAVFFWDVVNVPMGRSEGALPKYHCLAAVSRPRKLQLRRAGPKDSTRNPQ